MCARAFLCGEAHCRFSEVKRTVVTEIRSQDELACTHFLDTSTFLLALEDAEKGCGGESETEGGREGGGMGGEIRRERMTETIQGDSDEKERKESEGKGGASTCTDRERGKEEID